MSDRGDLIHVHGGELGLRRERRDGGVVIELPTDVDGGELRLEVERRVRELLRSATSV
jgi:hypothetical protein